MAVFQIATPAMQSATAAKFGRSIHSLASLVLSSPAVAFLFV